MAATLQPAADFGDRLVDELTGLAHPAHAQQENTQRVQAALVHQSAGHHLIVTEVAGQEPVIGMNVEFPEDRSHTKLASDRIELQHAVNQPHAGAVEG